METELNIHRYDRQLLIKDWDQSKLSKGIVTIVGSNNLSLYSALPLAALGVGTIRIIDSSNGLDTDKLLDISLAGKSKVKSLEEALKKINPNINIISIHSDLSTSAAQYFLEGSNVIIDATNDKISKSHVLANYSKINIPTISASSDETKGKITLFYNQKPSPAGLMPMFEGKQQGDLVSLLLGGVIAEETKKLLMNEKNLLSKVYNYNLESNDRFSHISDRIINTKDDIFDDKKILMVGAGALGCFLGPATVNNLKAGQLDILDYDTVEEHNLNRQVCFYNAVGKLKAESLVQTLKRMNKKMNINPIVTKFDENFSPNTKYDLIFDAVDSFFTKAMLHNFAKKNLIPIVSGGTDYRASTVLVYSPGKTSCFDCQINLYELAIKAEIIRRTSCIQAPNPSVIMTNQIAGALMVAEARSVLRPDLYGNPIDGEIKFISDLDSRGGINRLESICDCHTKEIRPLILPDTERVNVVEKKIDGELIQEIYLDGRKL